MDWHGGDGRICAFARQTLSAAGSTRFSILVDQPQSHLGWEVGVALPPSNADYRRLNGDKAIDTVSEDWADHCRRGRRRKFGHDEVTRIAVTPCNSPAPGVNLVLGAAYKSGRTDRHEVFGRLQPDSFRDRQDFRTTRVDVRVDLVLRHIDFLITPVTPTAEESSNEDGRSMHLWYPLVRMALDHVVPYVALQLTEPVFVGGVPTPSDLSASATFL